MKIIDISLMLDGDTIVYPKNPEFSVEKIDTGSSVLSKLTFGTHFGTHIDAPAHVFDGALSVDEMDLESVVGDCKVLDMTHAETAVKVEDLEKENIQEGDRVLLKTKNSIRGFSEFYDDYIYLDGDAADYLAEKKVVMVAIDYLSIKKRGGTDHRPHTSLLENNIYIIEGVDLSRVSAGEYFFIGLPLKLKGLDGSPIRAVLIDKI